MAHRHLVKGHTFNPISGRMIIEERYFPSLEDAKSFIEGSSFGLFKVFDHNNQLVHSGSAADDTSTYA